MLAAYLDDATIEDINRISVPECILRIEMDHPAARDDCIEVLSKQLRKYLDNGPTLNGFIIWALIDLGARQTIDDVRMAFAADLVDEVVVGDVEDMEIAFGVRTHRSTPPSRKQFFDWPLGHDVGGTGILPVRLGPKISRNEPCPCGSGKKFKKCCLN